MIFPVQTRPSSFLVPIGPRPNTSGVRKASDIDTVMLIGRIAAWSALTPHSGWVQSWHIQPWYAGVPWKILQAKLRRLHKGGLLNGCPCGCRGDWTVTDAGAKQLDAEPWEVES